MQHWLKPSFVDEADDSARADLARKPDPFFPAASHSAPASQHSSSSSNGARPAAFRDGAGAAAPSEADCEPSSGQSAADWVLSALSKPASQNGASGRPVSGSSASSNGSSHNGASGTPAWLVGGRQRDINLDAAANRGSAPALDSEPWVHNGAAGSGAEALARATLRSASAPVDVPFAGLRAQPHGAPDQRTEQHRVRSWGRPLAGHTDDEASSSDDDGGASLSEADPSPAMSPEATVRPDVRSSSPQADAGLQRRADGSADYII